MAFCFLKSSPRHDKGSEINSQKTHGSKEGASHGNNLTFNSHDIEGVAGIDDIGVLGYN